MPFDKNAFIADLTKDINLDDSAKQALSLIVEHPVIGQRIGESTLRQSDYSRLSNELSTKLKSTQEYWDGLKSWQAKEQARLDNEHALVKKRLTDEGISLETLNGEPPVNSDYVKRSDVDKLAQDSVAYFSALSTIQMKHLKEFDEILDINKVHEVIQRDGVNLNIAYERLVQPRREEIQQTKFQEQLLQARKEGAEEALKNVVMPTSEQPWTGGNVHALDSFEKKDNAPTYGAMVAAKAFMADRRSGTVLG